MNPFATVVFNMIIYLCTMVIMLIVLAGGFTDVVYIRELPNIGRNVSFGGKQDEWPLKMALRTNNFHCNIPSPNLALTDDQLTDAWLLPHQTRLSPAMRDIARCKLASKWLLVNKGQWEDDRRCLCPDMWWLLMVLFITVAAFGYYTFSILFRPRQKSVVATDLDELRAGRCGAGLWFLVWYLTLCFWSMRNEDIGLSFTLYGDMNPRAYYTREPNQWLAIVVTVLIICILEGIKLMIFCNAIGKAKKKLAENRLAALRAATVDTETPPPYHEAVSFEKMWERVTPMPL